jgi:uncharacterized protein YtpQ (UPF0354 family)
MRALLLTLFVALSGPVVADIAKPTSVMDTLVLMLDRLLPAYPDARIDLTSLNITLDATGDTVMNPDNLHSVLRNIENGADREAELDGFIATMIAANAAQPVDGPIPLDALYPVVRHASFAQNDGGMDLYSEPFVGDMIRVYAIDYPDYVAYVTMQNFDDGLTVDALHAAAADNLVAKFEITQFEQRGDVIVAYTDGFYESSLVVDGVLWTSVAAQFDDEIVMIVPARDMIAFAPASATGVVDVLADVRDDIITNGAHPLSALTYIWRGGAWQVLD